MGEKAVRRVVEPDILLVLFDRHEADKALVYVAEDFMSAEQVHIQGDIAQVLAEVDVDVLRGVAVGDVAGMADAFLAEARVPSNVEPGKPIRFSHGVIRCAGVQVNIHASYVIPVDKKPHAPCFFRDPPGETAADVGAVLRFVRGLHQGMGEVEGTGIQPHLPAF